MVGSVTISDSTVTNGTVEISLRVNTLEGASPITGVNMSKDLQPTVPSLIQFQQDLKLNGKGIRTQQSYLRALRKFHEFLSKDPASATEDELRRYLLHIVDTKQWRPSKVNVAQAP